MKLYWAQYRLENKSPRRMMLLVLGVHNGKLHCLDADALDTSDKEFMRSKAAYFDKMALNDKVAMLKELRPSTLKHFKTIYLKNLVIDREYSINSKSVRP